MTPMNANFQITTADMHEALANLVSSKLMWNKSAVKKMEVGNVKNGFPLYL
jgi:hypothetical protein